MTDTPDRRQESLSELIEFLRIPSVSTLPEHRPQMQTAAAWVERQFRKAGLPHVERITVGDGHPLVFGERIDDPAAPTALLYGHYDVQPADPLNEWESPPFEPVIRDGKIFARGASDDKGQCATHLFALQELSERWGGRWPVNVKILVEGEEEAGGASIEKWVPENRERLTADFVLISDTAFLRPGLPSIDYGLRGICYAEIHVQGAARDLHSGLYGGGILNPALALSSILSKLVDVQTGRVLVPGFYDDVIDPTEEDRRLARLVPFDEKAFRYETGASALWGETGYSTYERITSRPCLDVNGIHGGFSGEGAKTIIPARASAKVSMRLVPDQDPADICRKLEARVLAVAPPAVTASVRPIHMARGLLMNPHNPWIEAASDVLQEVFGARPALTRCGASIPVSTVFHEALRVPVVFMGFGLPDDRLHSPNEKFDLSQFYGGIEAVKRLLLRMPEVKRTILR